MIVAAIAGLTGCQTTPEEPSTSTSATAPAPTPAAAPEPDLSLEPRERLSRGIQHLERGEERQAQAELRAYLAATPGSSLARRLLAQIDTPIDEVFPSESFALQLEPGQSLSNVAATYLGDAMLFHSLAKYNGIDNPSQVKAGQLIRVPATEAALAVQTGALLGEDSGALPQNGPQDALEDAPQDSAQTPADDVIAVVEAEPEPPAAPEPTPAELKLADAEALIGAQDYRGAYDALVDAQILAPDDAEIADQLAEVRATYIDDRYRAAVSAFNRQDLAATLEACDDVLAIDPQHANAMLYKTQALELQERLLELGGDEGGGRG